MYKTDVCTDPSIPGVCRHPLHFLTALHYAPNDTSQPNSKNSHRTPIVMEKTKGNNRKEQRRQLELYLVVAVKNIDHSKSGSRAQKTVQGVNKDILTN